MILRAPGTVHDMKIMRTAALAAVAKKVFDEARKPQNQAKIKSAVDKAKQQMGQRRRGQ